MWFPVLISTIVLGQETPLDEARSLQQQGRITEAVAILETLSREEPANLDAGALLAWIYAETDRPELAIDAYRRLLGYNPENADLYNGLGALLFRSRRFEEAKPALVRATELAPEMAMAHFNLGLLNFEQGEFTAASESLERAAELEPQRALYHMSLARSYRASYMFERATKSFRAALAQPAPPSLARMARLELALTLKHQGFLNESGLELRALLDAFPDDPDALFQLGRLEVSMNRYAEAEAVLRRLTAVRPDDGPAHFMLGLVFYRQDDPRKALDSFRTLLALDPEHAEGSYYVGMIHHQLGDYESSRRAFEDALAGDPEHLAATYNLALLLQRMGEPEAAQAKLTRFQELSDRHERLSFLEERVRLNPANAKFYLDLGREYARQKRVSEAIRALHRAIELDPGLAEAEVELSSLLSQGPR